MIVVRYALSERIGSLGAAEDRIYVSWTISSASIALPSMR
jgi:hypothetical protein